MASTTAGRRNGPRLRRGSLTPEMIVTESLRLLDAHGQDGFSLPKLGRALGADPTAVYRHFASKDDLVLAIADRLIEEGGRLASLDAATVEKLNKVLPPTWSHGNPIDIIGDATPQRYLDAVSLCMADEGVDGALVILTPQAMTQPLEVAQTLGEASAKISKPLLTCWMGDTQIRAGRAMLAQSRIPAFRTPEAAVEAFCYNTAY